MDASPAIPTVGLGLPWEDTPVGFRFKTIGRTIFDADITAFIDGKSLPDGLYNALLC